MRRLLSSACMGFRRDQGGHAAVMFAFGAIPLIGLIGGATDVARHVRYKAQILNAMDSAAVALVRRGAENDADADKFVNDYIAAMLPQYAPQTKKARGSSASRRDPMLHLESFNATEIEGGYRVTSNGGMETAFMPVVGISEMPLDLESEGMLSTGKYEVALALDNTGSMREHGRIGALRDAAGQLVEDLYAEEGTEDRVKMALVPFVTAVNIRSKTPGVFDRSWIEAAPRPDNGAYNFGFRSADGKPVDRLELFDQMGVAWRGCVEARAGGQDEEDSIPVDASTRWVPYLWPDEPDTGDFNNNYLDDSVGGDDLSRLRDVRKYDVPARVKVQNTISDGPNAACPRPIVELTNDRARMLDEIGKMVPHNTTGSNNSGTNVAEGLMWAWRVLSPDEPFSQGVSYKDKETQKVLVLLSDGRNQIVANDDVTESDYTSYGYLAAGRLGSTDNYLVAERAVDDKVKRVCEKVKAAGIRVYTILFQVDFERTKDVFRNCASKDDDGKPLYQYVPNASELGSAFAEIGKDLTKLAISR